MTMRKAFVGLKKEEQIKFLKEKNISTQIDGDIFETPDNINDVEIFENENEYFIAVFFNKDSLFNENTFILYDNKYNPLGKLAYSVNEKDKKISFDYFFVKKELRGQHLGQSMIDIFLERNNERYGEDFEVYTNPYSFDVSFNGIKGYDYESQMHQYKLEQFYLNNGFLLTEDPKKYVFGELEYDNDAYKLTPMPLEEDYHDFLNKKDLSFGRL